MTLPEEVEIVLKEYINLLHDNFPGTLVEIYVHGSIALGAYEDKSSDIDFLTVMNRRLTEGDYDTLSSLHTKLGQKYKKPELDGVYVSREELITINPISMNGNGKYLFYNEGELQYGNYFNFNPVTWWTLKNDGIKILESNSMGFMFDVSAEELVSYVHDNMNSYWLSYIQRIENNKEEILNFTSIKIDEVIEWVVLGLLRQFYTMKELGIISKLAAGDYGIKHLPSQWHPIIREAINLRKGEDERIFHSQGERLEETIQFSRFLIEHCNRLIEVS